ncbi:hypothetical protein PENTCL1PPCAC_24392, partial [Pristionchus entomophagus]
MDSFCADDFWDDNFTLSESIPHLTTCFEHTVLVYLPAAFLVLFLPIFLVQARRISRRFDSLPVTALFVVRLILTIYLFLNATAVFVLNTFILDGKFTVDIVYPCVLMVFFLLHLFIDYIRLRCGQNSSGIQHLSLVLLSICGVPEFGYHIENTTFNESMPIFILYMAFWPIVVLQTFLYCFTDKRKPDADKSEELDSGFLNRLTNWWFTTVQIRGAKNDLEMDDLFDLNPGSKSPHLGALFEKYWIPKLKGIANERS